MIIWCQIWITNSCHHSKFLSYFRPSYLNHGIDYNGDYHLGEDSHCSIDFFDQKN